ncbi:hypothetical protein FJT64_003712 [Amphibalanus amphitrite]|nr:uncharacterized protein LOC122365081 [Amphibalanus amphitrite]KAF0298941.1 hypothetical protein FJT64_003712 [Amphibalanus amphitrite]
MPVMEGDTSQEAASADTPATTAASDERARPLASFRLPAFAPDEADLWLLQVECAFDVAGIADPVTKFKLLVANLPTNVAAQVRDVIVSAPGDFDGLCTALRQRLAQSRASRLEALLRHQQLGDRSPSQLLRDMRGQLSTAGDSSVDSGLLRTLFLQRLPQSARAALSLLPEATPLAELAEAADRFLEASRPTGAVSAVGANSSPAPAATTGDGDLAAAIASLSAVISRLDTSHRRLEGAVAGRRSRPGTPRRGSRSSSPSRDEREDYCWYHRTYGARARKCTGPCAWTPAGNSEA